MNQYADLDGVISRNSMRCALEANIGRTASETDVDVVMSRLSSSEDHGGSVFLALVEADIAVKSFVKNPVARRLARCMMVWVWMNLRWSSGVRKQRCVRLELKERWQPWRTA